MRRDGAKSAKEDAKKEKMEKDFYGFRGRPESKVADDIEELAYEVIGAAIEVHRILGPGLLESVYKKALSCELRLRSIPHTIEEPFDVPYKQITAGQGRLDLFVDNKLIVELKAVQSLTDLDRSQALTYLTVKGLPLAILINFNVTILKDGIKRVVNTR